MSTAEQIIAPHLNFEYNIDTEEFYCLAPDCTATFEDEAGHAAHVVAALTNAGKQIVEPPEASRSHNGYTRFGSLTVEGGRVVDYRQGEYTPWEARTHGLQWLAAAREAEGGERGE
ncbi:hypothetical protein [Prescottella equi]|uniref:hypothetical protein n=1 Tax=Rhodococcus hoagii TaxID=43767 RepID=UPI000A117333|nr:hypothetical protein [Prescottella equi]ORL83924.1 hypothetical protein A5N71_01395 [Prescottella equi]